MLICSGISSLPNVLKHAKVNKGNFPFGLYRGIFFSLFWSASMALFEGLQAKHLIRDSTKNSGPTSNKRKERSVPSVGSQTPCEWRGLIWVVVWNDANLTLVGKKMADSSETTKKVCISKKWVISISASLLRRINETAFGKSKHQDVCVWIRELPTSCHRDSTFHPPFF